MDCAVNRVKSTLLLNYVAKNDALRGLIGRNALQSSLERAFSHSLAGPSSVNEGFLLNQLIIDHGYPSYKVGGLCHRAELDPSALESLATEQERSIARSLAAGIAYSLDLGTPEGSRLVNELERYVAESLSRDCWRQWRVGWDTGSASICESAASVVALGRDRFLAEAAPVLAPMAASELTCLLSLMERSEPEDPAVSIELFKVRVTGAWVRAAPIPSGRAARLDDAITLFHRESLSLARLPYSELHLVEDVFEQADSASMDLAGRSSNPDLGLNPDLEPSASDGDDNASDTSDAVPTPTSAPTAAPSGDTMSDKRARLATLVASEVLRRHTSVLRTPTNSNHARPAHARSSDPLSITTTATRVSQAMAMAVSPLQLSSVGILQVFTPGSVGSLAAREVESQALVDRPLSEWFANEEEEDEYLFLDDF